MQGHDLLDYNSESPEIYICIAAHVYEEELLQV